MTYDQYRTALLNIAAGCEFEKMTPDEILRDRLVFGIRDNTVQERLLRKSTLTLTTTDEVCHAAESMRAQMKIVDEHTTVNAIKSEPEHQIKSHE